MKWQYDSIIYAERIDIKPWLICKTKKIYICYNMSHRYFIITSNATDHHIRSNFRIHQSSHQSYLFHIMKNSIINQIQPYLKLTKKLLKKKIERQQTPAQPFTFLYAIS